MVIFTIINIMVIESNIMSKKDVLAELKSAIAQKATPHPLSPPDSHTPAASPGPKKPSGRPREGRQPKVAAPEPRSGRGVQFYLEEGDRKIINSLAVWFMSQDRRVSDSQVIKAAIRLAEKNQGAKLLELCDEVRGTDRRRHARKPRK